jgi:hypothetical protein
MTIDWIRAKTLACLVAFLARSPAILNSSAIITSIPETKLYS